MLEFTSWTGARTVFIPSPNDKFLVVIDLDGEITYSDILTRIGASCWAHMLYRDGFAGGYSTVEELPC